MNRRDSSAFDVDTVKGSVAPESSLESFRSSCTHIIFRSRRGLDLPPLTDGSSCLSRNSETDFWGRNLMTAEEELIQRYFDAFNNHDIERSDGLLSRISGDGRRDRHAFRGTGGSEAPLRNLLSCGLPRTCGPDQALGHGVAESYFRGTRPRYGKVIEAIGAEVLEIEDGRIKEIRDYHRPLSAKAA